MSSNPPPYLQPQAGYAPPQAGYAPPQAGYLPPQAGYAPPQAGYAPAYPAYPPGQVNYQTQAPSPVVITTQPTGTPPHALQSDPASTTCPGCNAKITTIIKYEIGTFTWIVALVLCILGCWPFCLIPFCCGSCKDAVHTCPQCGQTIYRWNRM